MGFAIFWLIVGIIVWAGCGFAVLRFKRINRPIDSTTVTVGWFGGVGCTITLLATYTILALLV